MQINTQISGTYRKLNDTYFKISTEYLKKRQTLTKLTTYKLTKSKSEMTNMFINIILFIIL